MSSPLISIITPSYNQSQYIEDTLRSVRNQTYQNVEHIVIDGNSDDGTVEILEAYDERYNLTWISEPDEGQSDAINKGFSQADGDIVAWLNSDDVYFDVDTLGRVARYFTQYDEDVIYGDLAYIDQRSCVNAIDVRPDFDAAKLPYRILLGQPATFFRQNVVKEEKLRTDLQFCMDYEYWLRLAKNYSFRHVQDIFAGFRAYEEQKSQNREAMAAELRGVFTNYSYPEQGAGKVLYDNIRIELTRLLRAATITYRLHQQTPPLAFDGQLAPLPVMLLNLGPSAGDATKVWRRFRSRGQTG